MRMMPARALAREPAIVKRQRAQVKHILPPLKGLSLSTEKMTGDPLTAPILTNFYIEDDRIQARAGYIKLSAHASGQPVWRLVPFYGQPQAMVSAVNHTLSKISDGAVVRSGFTSDDWSWTSFSNLSNQDYTVMVNGADGVWSWDGGMIADGAVVTVAAGGISKANPAVVTVAAADIGKFSNGMSVKIAGATGDFAVCNGNHIITSVNSPVNTFVLPSINTSAATGTSNAGVTATPLGSFVKETVTAPAGASWINPNQFNIVLSHMNRLWFADSTNLAVYYLPLQTKTGEVKALPLNAVFTRGGSIKAMYTWTIDGGRGMDDQLVIMTSNGETVIYSGTDPDTASAFQMVGVFRFGPPMSKHATVNYGGDLYVLISTGLVPMSTMLRAETEKLGKEDRTIISFWLKEAVAHLNDPGWETFLNPATGRLFCNVPQGGGRYVQMIRHMPRPVWSKFVDIPARCWQWLDPYVYFGDDKGGVYQMHPSYRSDNGAAINVDVQMAWSQFGTPAIKQFKMVQTYILTDGRPRPFVDVKVNYDSSPPVNWPEISTADPGAVWNTATWDVDYWASSATSTVINWTGIAAKGSIAALRLTARVQGCEFAIAGWDIIWEAGSVFG